MLGSGASRCRWGWAVVLASVLAAGAGTLPGQIIITSRLDLDDERDSKVKVKPAEPVNSGLAKLLCASPYGVKGRDWLTAVKVLKDGSILLAGRMNIGASRSGVGQGYLVRLTVQGGGVRMGTRVELPGDLNRLKIAPDGSICVLLDGEAVYMIAPGASEPTRCCVREKIKDFGVDADGELVLLHGEEMTRFDATWQNVKWTAKWHCHGTNTPTALDVCTGSGVATVLGSGLAHTGRAKWRGPYAHAFGRDGKQVWKLWDQEPNKQLAKKDGGNDMTTDTFSGTVKAGADGRFYAHLYAANEKTILTRDPNDSDKDLPREVFDGVYQKDPGKGFSGSSPRTSAVFRVDAATGRLEKGTWLCAWLKQDKTANPLAVNDLAVDGEGRICVVGSSDWGCPTKDPWYYDENIFRGGGCLSILDKDFKMLQSGYFLQTALGAVDAGNGFLVVGGAVLDGMQNPELPLQVYKPVQDGLAGGMTDGFFAIFETGPHAAEATPTAKPTPKPTPEEMAAQLLLDARQALQQKRVTDGRTKLEYIVSRYPDTAAGKAAQELLDGMKTATRPAVPVQPAASEADEKAANALLQQAEMYLTNGLRDPAKTRLKDLVKKYPKTQAGKAGQQLLDKHFWKD